MKRTLCIVTCLLTSLILMGQSVNQEVQKQIEELSCRIILLENENHVLAKDLRARDSVSYCAIRHEIFKAFTVTPQLKFDFKNTTDKIAVTELFTKLMQANNPSSDILGFRFNEIVFSACEEHLFKEVSEEKERNRLGHVIGKIINNPVVSTLANTNPLTSVVAAIISTVAGFASPAIEMYKEGGRIKEVAVENKDIFQTENIRAFREELQVYINFYDALILAASRYLKGLENLNTKYTGLMQSVRAYQDNLFTFLDGNETNLLLRLAEFLPDPQRQHLAFNDLISDKRILNALAEARKLPVIQQSVLDFKKEYNHLLFGFLSDYMEALRLTNSFPPGTLDPHKVEALVQDIAHFIEGQKADINEPIDVFMTK